MTFRALVVACVLLLPASSRGAQDPADPVQAIIEQERIRVLVESAFARVAEERSLHSDPTAFVEAYTDIAYELGTAEPAVVPLLANEALQADPTTFYFAAYALAFQATPEAIEALYAALERADGEQSSFAIARKAYLVWALASAGDVRGLRLADQGRHSVGEKSPYLRMSVIEAATILTAPESIELLHGELSAEDVAPSEELRRTMLSIRALGRVGDPSSLPILLKLLKSQSVLNRMEAAKALALYPSETAVDALFEAVGDQESSVSSYAAHSLVSLLPRGRFDDVAKRLETTTSPPARKALYELLARLDGPAAVPLLMRYTKTPDSAERRAVFAAAAVIRSPDVLDLLIHGLADPDGGVGNTVVRALAEHDHPRANRVLLQAIVSPRWSVAQNASLLAVQKRLPGAGEPIRRRLLKAELPKLTRNSSERPAAEWLLDRLVEYEDVAALAGLEESLGLQHDPVLMERMETAIRQLKAARDAGEDLEKWKALAFDDDPAIRMTAYRHLGRDADADAAAKILAMAFGRVEPAEGEKILDRISTLDSDESRELVERVLTSSQYQRPELYSMRNNAAWAARRLGGERMRAALRRSIEMRHGRDVAPVVYYTLLSGKEAIPLIEPLIVTRMRFNTITRGKEYRHLRELLSKLKLGHRLDYTDVSPGRLDFR